MTGKREPSRRRGTPISDSLGADLQALGTILANHTHGLDDYLQRQAGRIEEHQQNLLAETPGFLLPPDQNLEAMTAGELQSLCRRKRLRGWSKLRRDDLLTFVKRELGPELEAMRILQGEEAQATTRGDATGTSFHADANRSERLLLLVLSHLGVPEEDVQAAWLGSQEPA